MTISAKELFGGYGGAGQQELNPERSEQERTFFAEIGLSHRMEEVPPALAAVNGLILRHVRGDEHRNFLDISTTSAMACDRWYSDLREAGLKPVMVAMAPRMNGYLVEIAHHVRVLMDGEGVPIQYDFRGLVVSPRCRPVQHLWGCGLFKGALRTFWRYVVRELSLLQRLPTGTRLSTTHYGGQLVVRKFPLVSPHLRYGDKIRFIDEVPGLPIPDEMVQKFDFIRVVTLNRHEAFPAEWSDGMKRLGERLAAPGALLLLGEIAPDHGAAGCHATLFRLIPDGRLEVVERIGNGALREAKMLSLHWERPKTGEMALGGEAGKNRSWIGAAAKISPGQVNCHDGGGSPVTPPTVKVKDRLSR